MLSGSLSPRHGVSSDYGYIRRPPDMGGGVFADTVSGSHGQTRPDSGPPVWCLGEELTINEHIKEYYTGPPTWYL